MALLSWSDPYGGHSIADLAAQFQVRAADVGDVLRSITAERTAQQKQLSELPIDIENVMQKRQQLAMEQELNKARIAHLNALAADVGAEKPITPFQQASLEYRRAADLRAQETAERRATAAERLASLQERERAEAQRKTQVEEYGKTATAELHKKYGLTPDQLFDSSQTQGGKAIYSGQGKERVPTKFTPKVGGGPDIQVGGAIMPKTEHEAFKRRLYEEGAWTPGGTAPTQPYPTPPPQLPTYVSPRGDSGITTSNIPAPAVNPPVSVSSADEAAQLAPGTVFQTPDGRIMRKR
jgi:hypothetical protein